MNFEQMPLINIKLQALASRLSATGWELRLRDPQEVASILLQAGRMPMSKWELALERTATNYDIPKVTNGIIRATIQFDNLEQIRDSSVEFLARRLALAMAGLAVHEAFECVRLDGEPVIDPHGNPAEMDEVLDELEIFLKLRDASSRSGA